MKSSALFAIALMAGLATAQPMAGTYSVIRGVPTAGNNFATISDAVASLISNGVSGPVTIELDASQGPYTATMPFLSSNSTYSPADAIITLGTWAGASTTNRVTFTSMPGTRAVLDASAAGMGIFFGGADYVTIDNLEIRGALFDGISLYSEAQHGQVFDAEITRCIIHSCRSAGIVIYGNSSRPQNTLIASNFFYNLQIANGGGFSTTARFGYVSGRRHDNSRVVGNTFYVNTASGGAFCVIGDRVSGGVGSHFAEISGNIFVKTATGGPIYDLPDNAGSGIPAIVESNCYFDTSGDNFSIGSVVAPDFLTWQTNAAVDVASITSDPLLVDPANGDLHLTPGSPCVGASVLTTGPAFDIDGETRSAPFDIGADELVSACSFIDWQINQLGAYLSIDGSFGTGCNKARVIKTPGSMASASFQSSNVGQGFEVVVALGQLRSRSNGAPSTLSGQIINADLFSPVVVFVNGGLTPNFSVAFPGNFNANFTAPPSGTIFGAQLAVLNPAHPDGVQLSQAVEVESN